MRRQVHQLERRLDRVTSGNPDAIARHGHEKENGDAVESHQDIDTNHHESLLANLVSDRDTLQRLLSQQNALQMRQQQLVDTQTPVDALVSLGNFFLMIRKTHFPTDQPTLSCDA